MPRIPKGTAFSAFLHCLKSIGSSLADNDRRDLLKAGAAYSYELEVTGKVAGYQFSESYSGKLTVDHNREEFAPLDAAHLLALALEAMPQGDAFVAEVEGYVAENGKLPPVDEDFGKTTAALVKRLRHRKRTKRGAVKAR